MSCRAEKSTSTEGPDDLEIKIQELREITNWEKPIYVKVGAARSYYDTALAVKAGADVVVLDGMQGGTAATQDVFIEHVGIPTLGALREAVDSLKELNMHRKVQLIVSGGIRSGADDYSPAQNSKRGWLCHVRPDSPPIHP